MSSLTSDKYEFAKWIDPGVIADAVFDQKGVNTVEHAKEVWLDFLQTELTDGLKRSAKAVLRKRG
jgi:hypothetical protein